MQAKVFISDRQKKVKLPTGTRLLIKRCCNAVLNHEMMDLLAEISVTIVDNTAIKELNATYRDKNNETDVLSFPLGEDGEYDIDEESGAAILGDIVISAQKAQEQARIYGHSIEREIAFLTVHSMFHLLGYDHEQGGIEARIMREKEEAVLEKMGLSREESFVEEE